METVNSYLIKGDENVLIDSGENSEKSWEALLAGLSEYGLTIGDIDRLIITHAHVDHIGMADRVSRAADCPVWVSDMVYPWAVDVRQMWQQRTDLLRKSVSSLLPDQLAPMITGMFESMSSEIMKQWSPISEDRLVQFAADGDALTINGIKWDVLYAPGHSITQSCFYQPVTQQMISADMLLKITPTPVIEADPEADGERELSILTMLESYAKFREIPMSMVYPGHYETFDDPIKKIDQQVHRIHKRKEECYALITSGVTDLFELFQQLYKGRFHLPAFNMTLAYIDLLIHEGRLKIVDKTAQKSEIVLV